VKYSDVVTIGIPSLSEDDFTKETIRVEYEWRPPRCDTCKIFGHVHDYFPKKVVSPPIVATSNVVTPNAEKTNDGFQTVGKKKKRKATTSAPMKGTTYVGYTSQSTPMLKTTGNSSNKDNLSMSNSFFALNKEEEDEEEVENVYDESANLIHNTKAGGSSSFTAAAGLWWEDIMLNEKSKNESKVTIVTVNRLAKKGIGCDFLMIVLDFVLYVTRGGFGSLVVYSFNHELAAVISKSTMPTKDSAENSINNNQTATLGELCD
ncbi:hypothetical protein Tco_0728579, partial [Tanacetum coccineum]